MKSANDLISVSLVNFPMQKAEQKFLLLFLHSVHHKDAKRDLIGSMEAFPAIWHQRISRFMSYKYG